MCSDSRRRLQNLSPSSFPFPHHHGNTQRTGHTTHTTDPGAAEPAKHPVPITTCKPASTTYTTKLPKITTPTLFTGLQDDLDHFKAECSLYIHLRGSKFPNKMSWMLFILAYMKGGATGTWAMHKIQQVLNPSRTPMTMDEFKAKVDLMFMDPNQEATA